MSKKIEILYTASSSKVVQSLEKLMMLDLNLSVDNNSLSNEMFTLADWLVGSGVDPRIEIRGDNGVCVAMCTRKRSHALKINVVCPITCIEQTDGITRLFVHLGNYAASSFKTLVVEITEYDSH